MTQGAGKDGRSPPNELHRQSYLASRLQGFGTTIFAQMSALAIETGAINLGQGFPDSDGPPEVLDEAIAAIQAGHNQYPPGIGIPELRQSVSQHQQRFYDLTFDPDSQVLITAGATEAITAALLALCEDGDEVITFEPYYDSYAAAISMAGGQRRCVQLIPPDFSFSAEKLRQAVTNKTRLILLNSPHNPTGKVFSREELQLVADLAIEHDLLVITDEVYEHIVFDGQHMPIASFPGMFERTVTISSGGKTFACTGWKIGWVCASKELVKAVQTAKQFLTYVNGAPFQPAIARGLLLEDSYFDNLAKTLQARRDELCEGLKQAGLEPNIPQGTYFVTTDISQLAQNNQRPAQSNQHPAPSNPNPAQDGMEFCLSLPVRCGVVAVPIQVFCDDLALGQNLVRFAFCKQAEVIEEASRRLATLR